MEFNERILKARKEKGISQEALAECLGVSRQAVSKWETGEARPDVEKLAAICTELSLSMDELVLGRKVEEKAAEMPKKRKNLPVLILAAVVIFALGLACGRWLFPREIINSVAHEPEIPAVRVQDIEIVDVVIEREYFANYGDQRQWIMSVMPENPAEGLMVRFLLEQELGVKNTTVEAQEAGAYFTAYYPASDYGNVSFTAELELNGEIKRVPLRRITNVDSNSYSFEDLWKED